MSPPHPSHFVGSDNLVVTVYSMTNFIHSFVQISPSVTHQSRSTHSACSYMFCPLGGGVEQRRHHEASVNNRIALVVTFTSTNVKTRRNTWSRNESTA